MTIPSQGRSEGLTKLENRVKNLIAKADSTEFEEEAETYRKQAAKLIAKYSIDAARLTDMSAGQRPIVSVVVDTSKPYAKEFQRLVGVIAMALSCSGLDITDGSHSYIYGSQEQVDQVMMYYELIWPQMLVEVSEAYPDSGPMFVTDLTDRPTLGPSGGDVRSYRRSFAAGFAVRIGQRLEEVMKEAVSEEEEEGVTLSNFGSGALVLQTEQERAEAILRQDFAGKINERKQQRNYGHGLTEGYDAGDRADIGQTAVGAQSRSLN